MAETRKALGYLPTYCGVGVRAEHGVLPDDAIQLERGQPGHKDHGGRGRRRLDARGRTWNWTEERAFSHGNGAPLSPGLPAWPAGPPLSPLSFPRS